MNVEFHQTPLQFCVVNRVLKSYHTKYKADHLMHGKTAIITHTGCPIFKDIPEKFSATRYHSLIINEKELSPELSITARSENDNYIMAVSHKEYPTFGIQFHPESIATEHGIDILRNFIIL